MNKKKQICVALGQGGARSLAHIGVLQIFQEHGFSIERISGTSAGAIVGAVFAETLDASKTYERFQTLLKSKILRKSGLTDIKDPSRSGVTLKEKIAAKIRGVTALALAQNRLGVVSDRYFKKCLELLIHADDFSELRIPFSAMATDLLTGYAVEIASGSVISAVLASSSLPGLFPPVKLKNCLLVDGAVCCPVPVEHCGKSKDSVIAAVHVHSKLTPGYKPKNALDVLVRTEEINLRNLDRVKTTRADIHISPDTKDVGWNQVHRLDEMVSAGRTAAEAVMPKLIEAIDRNRSSSDIFHRNDLIAECGKPLIRL